MRLLVLFALIACGGDAPASEPATAPPADQAVAVFAGGCFWCMEKPFESLDGVLSVTSGYIGGTVEAPTYEQVSAGGTGHAEAVRVVYTPSKVGYERLLEVYWHNVDPFDAKGQFCDKGDQYRSAIFPQDAEQRRLAEASKEAVQTRLGREVVTRIEEGGTFWDAEAYHQDYYRTHPIRYTYYRTACGRDARLREVWGDAATH